MEKSRKEMQQEIDMLRREIKVAREAAEITSDFVVKQFEQTEKMLHRFQTAESERQAVLDGATQLSIIATDLDGTIQLFSKGATTLLGYSSREMVGKRTILSLHLLEELESYGKEISGIADSNLHDMKVFDQFVKRKQSRAQEWFYVCRDNSHLPVSLSITSLYNSDGRVVGYLFTAMDMTLQKQMERQLIQAKVEAESANTSKGDFLARMSHEIRTPMNGVIGMTSLLQKTLLDPKQHGYVDKILSSANTLLSLINDILDFSKIDACKLQLESVPFHLEDVLGNIANVVGMQAEKKGLEFLFQIDPNISQYLIGDPLRLGQILMNLAGNAVKFTEQGEIVICISTEECQHNEIVLRFSVVDSGIGLHKEQINNLFSAFSQADDTITRQYGGTGLGLAICKELTELMGGRIWVESEIGEGAQFIFTVKLELPEDVQSKEQSPSELLDGIRALVVDDNQAARDVLSAMLSSLNIEVDTAIDGESAILFLEKAMQQGKPYDIVLLDWMMPGIDGIETARRIKARASLAEVPAMLMVTANGREEAYVEADRVGMNGFLLKPVYASVMYNTLLDILGIKTLSGARYTTEKYKDIGLDAIRGSKILLVDDNSINQDVATEFLEDVGMVVTVAADGQESLDALKEGSFDLVLMDIQMPGMDGLEATRRIRQMSGLKDLPVIAMTAHAMAGDKEKSLAAGMNEHITKPIDSAELHRMLREWIPEKTPEELAETSLPDPLEITDIEDTFLPPMAGIDQQLALKTLENRTHLFEKMLYDFRKNFCSLPNTLKTLSEKGDWQEIQARAHAIKGVAGYIGATLLFEAAKTLEDGLKTNQLEEAGESLVSFIDALDEILSSLSLLPEKKQEIVPQREDCIEKDIIFSDMEMPLQTLISQLEKGELAAEEHFAGIREMLTGSGLDTQLNRIAELIDDIEYEHAAESVAELLTMIQKKYENA